VLLAAIAAACLGFSGVAQAAAPPDPDLVGLTTLSHIELDGVLGTELTVAPGQDVKLKADWKEENGVRPASGCAGCADFVATAFAGNPVAGCIENEGGFEGSGLPSSGSGEVDLGPASKTGGTYNVVAVFGLANVCGRIWNASASTGYQVIARVTVANPPTRKGQCKKGGWRELTDRNGTLFKNQGQCVRFGAEQPAIIVPAPPPAPPPPAHEGPSGG
jgi:hypothetical protein